MILSVNNHKVKPNHIPAGDEARNANEALRILAKMIARRLLTKRHDVDQKRPSAHGPDA